MIKKYLILLFLILILIPFAYSKNSFYIRNQYGALIKVDIGSAFEKKLPKKKGPTLKEVPREMEIDKFENEFLNTITDDADKDKLLQAYTKNETENKYIIKPQYENIVELTKIRNILMYYNKDNEMLTGLDQHGTPMPHNFPRVFEAKTKANFDIHFAWGVKFDNFYTAEDVKLGRMFLGFSVNLTNFTMPSLEIMVKYNFYLPDYPVEPYIGGLIYGGFMDGFPIGFSALGGADIFPFHYEDRVDNRNFFLSGELRVGTVLFAPIYFDTGENTEGIWKKLTLLGEGGFYAGWGYVWDN